jgi:hypothetical protein
MIDAPLSEAPAETKGKQTYVGNKQAFKNRPSTGLAIGDEFSFHEEKSNPNLTVINERPEHMLICMLKMQGKSNNQIAEHMQYTPAWVSQITRQPWFKDRLFQLMKEAGVDIIQQTLQMEVLPNIERLIDIRDSPTAGARAQSAAAMYLLDRVMGKPTQRSEVFDGGKLPTPEDSNTLDSEIQRAEAELKRLAPGQSAA